MTDNMPIVIVAAAVASTAAAGGIAAAVWGRRKKAKVAAWAASLGEPGSGHPMVCMACEDDKCDFKPMSFERRALGPRDVLIEMKYCGVCHTDVHFAANHTKGVLPTSYPCVPGHELAGVCTAVGSQVTKVKVGDHVGVGCMVDSCQNCGACKRGEEQLCPKQTATYQGEDLNGNARVGPAAPHNKTLGGYSTKQVVDERFAIIIPPDYPLEMAGPVMCAGITMYDPLKRQGATEGTRVGIVGLGGLGIMGIKLAKGLGCKVTAIGRAPTGSAKHKLATSSGADVYVCSKSADEMKAAADSLDLILNTIPVYHNYMDYQPLVASTGKQVLLGLHEGLIAGMVMGLMMPKRSRLIASGIGGVANTQEVIDLCAKEKIYPEIQVVPVQKLNWVYEQLSAANESGLRYVLDIQGTLGEKTFGTCNADAPNLGPPVAMPGVGGILRELAKVFFLGRWR